MEESKIIALDCLANNSNSAFSVLAVKLMD